MGFIFLFFAANLFSILVIQHKQGRFLNSISCYRGVNSFLEMFMPLIPYLLTCKIGIKQHEKFIKYECLQSKLKYGYTDFWE